ncbi:hypothetical protein L596_002612 [Steinernema carpocapsae]|uniref:Pyrrolo-quinoline quinone repeat domain-containing protein n=1 Tax=Steinernema carpocapsae TaxID=34508 RepID=A0A4U8UPU9_STECR|nr:hypothetical protein L596_002612 [Steinernema carpocapsae]
MRKKCLTSCLLALFALLLLIPGTNSENSLHHTSVSNQPFVLLTATLDGQLVALNSANGKRLWSFKEDPVVRTPPTGLHDFTFVPSPVDGSIYVLQDDSAYELLYHSIPQLVHNSPCKSSGGVFYTGSKKGKWIGIDPQTGTRIEVYSSEDSEHRMCPASKTNATVFIGRTQYSLSMHQSTGHSPGQKGGRRWNITYIDYTADVLPSDFIYNYRHFISPKSGRVVTVDSSGENFWSVDFSSPTI